MSRIKRKQTTVMLDDDIRKEAIKVAKKRGLNTLSTLLNVLMLEYVEKNRDYLNRLELKDIEK